MDAQWDNIRTALATLRADLAELGAELDAMGVERTAVMARMAMFTVRSILRYASAPLAPVPVRPSAPTGSPSAVRPMAGGRRVVVTLPPGSLPAAA